MTPALDHPFLDGLSIPANVLSRLVPLSIGTGPVTLVDPAVLFVTRGAFFGLARAEGLRPSAVLLAGGSDAVIGLSEALAGQPWGFELHAIAPSVAWSLPASDLRMLSLADAESGRRSLRVACEDLQAARAETQCSSVHDLTPRLAAWLLKASALLDDEPMTLTQHQLSDIFATRRATMAELLKRFRAIGAVRSGRGWVRVIDRTTLADHACGCRDRAR